MEAMFTKCAGAAKEGLLLLGFSLCVYLLCLNWAAPSDTT